MPPEHSLHGKRYQDVPDFDVHGGLTYSDKCNGSICHVPKPGESDDAWWFGFDCGHAGDLLPYMEARHPDLYGRGAAYGMDEIYKSMAYVREQVNGLAEQLAKAEGKGGTE